MLWTGPACSQSVPLKWDIISLIEINPICIKCILLNSLNSSYYLWKVSKNFVINSSKSSKYDTFIRIYQSKWIRLPCPSYTSRIRMPLKAFRSIRPSLNAFISLCALSCVAKVRHVCYKRENRMNISSVVYVGCRYLNIVFSFGRNYVSATAGCKASPRIPCLHQPHPLGGDYIKWFFLLKGFHYYWSHGLFTHFLCILLRTYNILSRKDWSCFKSQLVGAFCEKKKTISDRL